MPSSSSDHSGGQVKVRCPYEDCRRKFWLEASMEGRKVRCDRCHRRFVVSTSPETPCLKLDESQPSAAPQPTRLRHAGEALEPLEPRPPTTRRTPVPLEDEKASSPREEPQEEAAAHESKSKSRMPAPTLDGLLKNVSGEDEDDDLHNLIPTTISVIDEDGSEKPKTVRVESSDDTSESQERPTEETRQIVKPKDLADSPHPKTTVASRPPSHSPAAQPAEAAPQPEQSIGFKPVQHVQSQCPQCGNPFAPTQTSCQFCGYRVGQIPITAVHRSKKLIQNFLKSFAAILFAGILAILIFKNWDTIRSMASPKPVNDARPSNGIQKAVTPSQPVTTFVRSVYEEVEVKDGEDTLIVVRQGQLMVRKGVQNQMVLVEVKTPEATHVGWVEENQVKEDPAADPEDLLGTHKQSPEKHTRPVVTLAFRQDATYVASLADRGSEINLWQVSDGELVRTYKGHQQSPLSVSFLKDDSLLSVATDPKGCRVWDPLTTATLRTLASIRNPVVSMPDGIYGVEKASVGLKLWNLLTATVESSPAPPVTAAKLSVSGNGRILLAQLATGEFQCFSLPQWKPEKPFPQPKPIRDFELSPTGKMITLVPQEGNEVLVFFRETGKLAQRIELPGLPLTSRFCRSDHFLAVALEGKESVSVYELTRPNKPLTTIKESTGWSVTALACSADGKTLATGHDNGSVRFWPLELPAASATSPEDEIKLDPDRQAKKIYSLFRSYLMNKDRQKAEAHYKELLEKHPDSSYTKKAKADMEKLK